MRRDIWIFLFALGLLVFNWPIISIFQDNLVIALFIIWLIFIVLTGITTMVSKREDGG
jgi:hypothetical protein